jgi:hypothetical protein
MQRHNLRCRILDSTATVTAIVNRQTPKRICVTAKNVAQAYNEHQVPILENGTN